MWRRINKLTSCSYSWSLCSKVSLVIATGCQLSLLYLTLLVIIFRRPLVHRSCNISGYILTFSHLARDETIYPICDKSFLPMLMSFCIFNWKNNFLTLIIYVGTIFKSHPRIGHASVPFATLLWGT